MEQAAKRTTNHVLEALRAMLTLGIDTIHGRRFATSY